jgi:hypothetical protein
MVQPVHHRSAVFRRGSHCLFVSWGVREPQLISLHHPVFRLMAYSGRRITESLGNATVRGEKDGKSKRGARLSTVCLSMYSITENIYYTQLSPVAILLQPEPNCFTSYNTREWLFFLPLVLSSFGLPLPPTVSEARNYFASTILILNKTRDGLPSWCLCNTCR